MKNVAEKNTEPQDAPLNDEAFVEAQMAHASGFADENDHLYTLIRDLRDGVEVLRVALMGDGGSEVDAGARDSFAWNLTRKGEAAFDLYERHLCRGGGRRSRTSEPAPDSGRRPSVGDVDVAAHAEEPADEAPASDERPVTVLADACEDAKDLRVALTNIGNANDLRATALRRIERAALAVDETITDGDTTDRRAQRRARNALLDARLALKACRSELDHAHRVVDDLRTLVGRRDAAAE